ncbi:MAG: penicillin-binding protein 2 [Candidatus Moranbacteria bacterium]|nr:penicillin-binding protein 2 [Candidatus Moranbacteria bacterium]
MAANFAARGNVLKNRKTTSGSLLQYWRIYFLVFFVFLAAGVIFIRLYQLQVKAHEMYLAVAENQYKVSRELTPQRGEIYLEDERELYPLAVNQELQMAYAVPKEINDREKTASAIASILSLEKGEIDAKLSDAGDMFEVLKHKLSEEEVSKIKEENISGIYLMPESFRYYPGGELAAQVVGFVGSSGEEYRGQYGLEAFWEKELRGEKGNLRQEKDTRGGWISIADREIQPARDGADLVLTINRTVQYEAEKIIKETVEKHGADNGTIIAMDPKTGKILVIANYPSFNPNEYSKNEDLSLFMNPAVSTPYECGSVFKAVTAAAGIDDGKITPDTEYVDTGSVKEAGYVIKNSEEKAYGRQTMTQVLDNSINTGAIFIEKQIGNKKFADYVKAFGFGEKTGIELPGESPGSVRNLEETKRTIHFFTASFGQGTTVTPLQLANAYAAIANGGRLMKPQIVEKIIYPDGQAEEVQPQEIRRVISQDAAKKVSSMLLSVVLNGHGKRAGVPGYLVGGKTGTAQIAKAEEKGYEEGITVGSFAGYAPIDDPQFVVLVKVYNPKDVQWAESTAAPAFAKVMKFLLEYYGVKPTEE